MMSDGGVGAGLVVIQGGSQALDILKANGAGRVVSLFERSFYIAFDQSWLCLGANSLPMGPLNVRSSAPKNVNWESYGLHIDDPVLSVAGGIRIGQALEFGTLGAIAWHPPAPPPWSVKTLRSGLDGLDRLVGPGADAGLSGFVLADWTRIPNSRVVAAARQPIDCLSRTVERAFKEVPPNAAEFEGAVIALLGLGPGLTPSGDDFLGGMLIALDGLKAPMLRTQLCAVIERHAQQRTNAISIAHLRAAGAGAGHAALHDVLNSLLCGDTEALSAQLAAIDRIGHSSGWDALAGVCVTLRAFITAQKMGVW